MPGPNLHDLSDADVEREARRLIGEYGADAEAYVDIRVMKMLEREDSAGAIAWARILEAVQKIQYNESKPS